MAEATAPAASVPPATLTPQELSTWLEDHRDAMAERWLREIRSRGGRATGEVRELLQEFLHLLVGFLPSAMGAFRPQTEPLFQQAAELYGNLGAHRGLAAGEAVEEFQLLREVILRFLYISPPGAADEVVGLREMLQLNRFLDQGVTYASVGHTDTLFFQLIHGAGVGETPTPAVLQEVSEQVGTLSAELKQLLRFQAGDGVRPA